MKDLTATGAAYVHPSTKQCNYTYTHPATPQCNVSSRLDTIENKVNTTSGVPRWYFNIGGTWNCPTSGYYTIILVGGGGGYSSNSQIYHGGATGGYTIKTVYVNAGNYSVTVGVAGDSGRDAEDGGASSISRLNLSANGGAHGVINDGTSNKTTGYEVGTLVGPGTVGQGGRCIDGTYGQGLSGAYSGAVAIY